MKNIFSLLKVKKLVYLCLLISLFLVCKANGAFASVQKYSNIGITKTASIEKINKAYVGVDFYWLVRRFDAGKWGTIQIKKDAIFDGDFFSRFKNFSAHVGWRMNGNVALEVGYLHLANVINLASTQETLNGAFVDIYFYQQITSNKYTCLESYAHFGFFFTHGAITKKYGYGFKTGGGIQLKIYGPLAVKFGIEYYYPGSKFFSRQGFLTLKTGFDLYFAS